MVLFDTPRFQLGQHVPLRVRTWNGAGTPTNPDAAPTVDIYDEDGTNVVTAYKLPRMQYDLTGLFGIDYLLDANFSTGIYMALYQWAVTTAKTDMFTFEVIPGGDAQGAYTALQYYSRPHAEFLVGVTEDGTIVSNRGPRI